MNTRGLMELVVLNIGYDLGILTPEIFAMMVIMALVTTLMTGPALDLIERLNKIKLPALSEKINRIREYRIILSFGNPEMGKSLLKLANGLVKKQDINTAITALHLSPNSILHHYNLEQYEEESFAPLIAESEVLNQNVTTLFKASDDIDADIIEITNKGDFDLLLVGIGQSIFEGSLLGRILGYTTRIVNTDLLIKKVGGKDSKISYNYFDDRTRNILIDSKVPVGILIDKKLTGLDKVLVPFYDKSDSFLIEYIQRLIKNADAQVTIIYPENKLNNQIEMKENLRAIEQQAPNHIALNGVKTLDESSVDDFDLLMISTEGWKQIINSGSGWLDKTPSILIIRP
jgi:hypothetical protein